VLTSVCAFAVAYLVPEHIDRQQFSRTVMEYSRNPTPENAVALEAQRRENERIHLKDSAVIASGLLLIVYGIWGARVLRTRLIGRMNSPGIHN